MRNAILPLIFLGAVVLAYGPTTPPTRGQNSAWAEKMFKDGTVHDFGSVPRGAQLHHKFTITNIYAVRMEVTSVQSGCGCVTATVAKRVLEPRESTTLDINMDGRRFTGPKTVIVRVTVGPEFVSTAEIRVSANSRGDIVFNPGQVSFGTVPRGQTPTQTIDIEYAGTLPWEVKEVLVPPGFPFTVTSRPLYRRPGQVGYQLAVTLKADAPAGPLKEDIHLKTNDPATPLVPVLIEANVLAALTVSPATLALGTIKASDTLTRRVVVRGSRPFRVTGVDGGAEVTLSATPSTSAAVVQTVTLKCQFTQPGDFRRAVKILTDLPEGAVTVTVEGTAAP
jgi:hypothetical protein